MAKQPAQKFKIGLITATVWQNDRFYSVDLSRSYKTDTGEWRNTAQLPPFRPSQSGQMRGTCRDLDWPSNICKVIQRRAMPGPKTDAAPPEAVRGAKTPASFPNISTDTAAQGAAREGGLVTPPSTNTKAKASANGSGYSAFGL